MGLGCVVMLSGVGLCRDVEWGRVCRDVEWGCGCRGVDGIALGFYDCHSVGWDGMAVGFHDCDCHDVGCGFP